MTFREDESRIRDRHLRENFAWLNRFILSLLKQHPGRQSLVMKRRSCGWSENFLMEVVTGSTCYVRWPWVAGQARRSVGGEHRGVGIDVRHLETVGAFVRGMVSLV